MQIHTVQNGDTLENIALLYLYNAARKNDIKIENGLLTDQIVIGQKLRIPVDAEEREATNFVNWGLVIDGFEISAVPSIEIEKGIDLFSPTFSFALPNEDIYKEVTQPFKFQVVDIYYQDTLILSGVIYRTAYSNSTIQCAGAAKTAHLEHCTLPAGLYPPTFTNKSLKQICSNICKNFGVDVDVDVDANSYASKPFQKVTIDHTERIAGFLIRLAKQRGLIIHADQYGNLIISKEFDLDQTTVLDLVSSNGGYSIDTEFDSTSLYSDLYAIRSKSRKKSAASAKKRINNIPVFRCKTLKQSDRGSIKLTDFINSEISRMLLDGISINLTVDFIKDQNGDILEPGKIITIDDPRCRISAGTNFFIRTATINTATNQTGLEIVPVDAMKNKFTEFWK